MVTWPLLVIVVAIACVSLGITRRNMVLLPDV
jgi:hypothetical protein